MTAKRAKDLRPGDRVETVKTDWPAGEPAVVRWVETHQGRARIYLAGTDDKYLTRWAEELVNLVEEA